MGYNKFRWWTNGRKKKLSVKKPLIERINNGDFDYSHYYSEAEAARKQSSAIYKEIMSNWGYEYEARQKTHLKNVRANKLDEEGYKDEIRILDSLKKELKKEFGFCLWDKAMNSRLMDAEQLYEFYLIERLKGQKLLIK